MSSSEIMDSGKLFGHGKSNFAQRFNLLNHYLKEKGSFGDLSLGLSNHFQPHGNSTNAKSKNLPPNKNITKVEPERAQMTIFYGGQVIVLNDFPADKVAEIMGMANKPSSPTTMITPASNVVHGLHNNLVHPPQPLVNDLPIARKASLARFFEKRKDRIITRAPYQTSNHVKATSMPVENKTWLGLASQPPFQMETKCKYF